MSRDRHPSSLLLRADAAFLGTVGLIQAVLEVAGYFGAGPRAAVFAGQPFTIGFFEAHALAFLIAVVLLRESRRPEAGPAHLLAASVHVVLGAANLTFWESFRAFDLVGQGVAATAAHVLFAVAQTAAFLRLRREPAASPVHSARRR